MTNPDDLEVEPDDGAESTGPKALRAQLKKLTTQLTDLQTENVTLKKDQRKRTVAEALEQHGASPRLAKFYDKDEASSDDVLAWLKENGEDFGWSEEAQADTDDEETMEQASRISRASQSAPQKSLAPRITPDYIKNAPREELIKLGIVRA